MKCKKITLFLTSITLLLANPIFAEDFLYTPPTKFTLDPKIIAIHHPVKTEHLAAQLYFDQGLSQLYAFNNDTAYWSFYNASKIDPGMPMAYWGMAIALIPNFQMPMAASVKKVAFESLLKAMDLSKNESEVEREYINALSQRLVNDGDEETNKKKYSEQLEKLSTKYQDDPDAAVFWAASLLDMHKENWSKDGKPLPGVQEAIIALEKVMKTHPNHLGANHYYIHAMDSSLFPEKALKSAERLKKLLPSSGHLLHMPSHIYMRVGDYHQAATCSEEALAADQEYVNSFGYVGTYPRGYISHTLYYLTKIYNLQERFNDAKMISNRLGKFYASHREHMPEMEYFAVMPLFTLMHFQEWQEILSFPKPQENMPLATLFWHFSRAMAFASMKNGEEAQKEKQLFDESKKSVNESETFKEEKFKKMISLVEHLMIAKIAENEQKIPEAITHLKQAIDDQNGVYGESPMTFFSSRQQLGALYLKLKQYKDAEQIFRDDLNKIPNNSRSLFGLKESLNGQSKLYDLYWVDQAFQQAFKYSDINLTVENL